MAWIAGPRVHEAQERVLMTAGTLHPKPIITRTRSRPSSPKGRRKRCTASLMRSTSPLDLYRAMTSAKTVTVGTAQTSSSGPTAATSRDLPTLSLPITTAVATSVPPPTVYAAELVAERFGMLTVRVGIAMCVSIS